jgi:enoyl-CoA hydratase/carnithine racemase
LDLRQQVLDLAMTEVVVNHQQALDLVVTEVVVSHLEEEARAVEAGAVEGDLE